MNIDHFLRISVFQFVSAAGARAPVRGTELFQARSGLRQKPRVKVVRRIMCKFVLLHCYLFTKSMLSFLVHHEAIPFEADLCFTADVFLFQREISEMHLPIGMKFCMMISSRLKFIMPVHNFGRRSAKKF